MTDSIGVIGVEEVKEHEDGSAEYSFVTDDETTKKLTTEGLRFILYCAAYEWGIQDALDSLERDTDEA